MRLRLATRGLATAIVAALSSLSVSAHAAPHGAGEMEEAKMEEDTERAARYHAWVDTVFGFGKTATVVNQVERRESERFTSQNLDMGLSYEFIEDLALGVEMPLTHATFAPHATDGTRMADALGNFELNAEYVHEIGRHVALAPSLEVAIPTAQGEELPTQEELDAAPDEKRSQRALDRFSAQRAAAGARGWEENHLFAPHRLGVVPRLSLVYEGIHGLELEPSVKMGALFSTRHDPFEGDVVLAIGAAYRAHKTLDVGARVWTNIPVGGTLPEDVSPIAVVEPHLRWHLGPIIPVLGVVIPFAGPLSHPENVGVRVAIAAHL